MDDAIVPPDSLALTALVHRGTKWRRTFWEATCPELDISVRADCETGARDDLQKAVQEFLQTASSKEIEESLSKGTTCSLEKCKLRPPCEAMTPDKIGCNACRPAPLRAMNFSDSSVESIKNNFVAPQLLGELLPQLNGEIANYFVAKSQELVDADGMVSNNEAKVLETIKSHFAEKSDFISLR